MNREHLAAMAEATALTRAGRLAEATALIQRTLAGEGPVRVVPGEIVVDEERLRDDGPTEARPPDHDASPGREDTTATGPAGADGRDSSIGRYGFSGSCNPDGFGFVPCSVVNVTLPGAARMLVVGTVRAHVEGGAAKLALGDCRIGTTSLSMVLGSPTTVSR